MADAKREWVARTLILLFTVGPFVGLAVAAWRAWNGLLSWTDIAAFFLLYIPTGLGITVGFHRLLTHRSFRTTRRVRNAFAVLGSMAVEGSVISWVANHRQHHAFADREGDPHSPHVGHRTGVVGALLGLFHAHLGWLFLYGQRAAKQRFAPDLMRDRALRWIDRTFGIWILASLALAFCIGLTLGGTLQAGLTALLWGGAVRIFVLHHVTYSINSLCHFFGRRTFPTRDESTNLGWLAVPSFGESWHNNHHAFPRSAEHGLRRWQLDPGAALIRALERLGLAWDVVRVPAEERTAARAST
jgi:stearoyl-CoA desaturase (Delta-9 desaturase)